MNTKSHGIIIDCKNCKYISGDENGGFDVDVPIKDKETGLAGSAKLHCTITHEHHNVELKKWQDADHQSVRASENTLSRVSETLESFADHRVCGNCNICPSEVIQIVKENNNNE